MRILIFVLAVVSICCFSIHHGLRPESVNALCRGNGSAAAADADDLGGCSPQIHYASGLRPVVPADFHYGFGGLLAATGGLYDDYFGAIDLVDVIDAAMTLPITKLAVAQDRK
ncbi:hypothetical protein ParKJ_06890 [Paraburkholderia fungorum]|jgi:hypothetical protein|uniref:Uncharacterized protein n=1 Tax=Paraburkholderia fungorum TaxID=134537 RepID=A0AAP5UU84_9BURK|nr:hypothetical protein [Paraburkholderia fungorum]MDT8837132.1 hypothetical protein [Paraburkholderia fungorum]PRZ53785.1 hypothetical protein BX589_109227 [Paraburkholderia fungorum]